MADVKIYLYLCDSNINTLRVIRPVDRPVFNHSLCQPQVFKDKYNPAALVTCGIKV